MIAHRAWLFLLGTAVLSTQLTGCTTSSSGTPGITSTPTSTIKPSNLTGSYLLIGSMPTYFVSSLSNQTNLAASFTVTASNISGSANFQGVCGAGGGFGQGYVGAITGTVNADGTFTAGFTGTGTNAQTLTIQGTVPTSAQGSWAGKFAFSAPGTVNVCASSFTGTFSAVPLPTATGTFSGSGALTSGTGSSGVVVSPGATYTLSTNLTQSGIGFNEPVTGDIQVSGFPCFSHGTNSTVGALSESNIESNVLNLIYTMDDGGSLQMAATINDTAGTQIAVPAIYVRGDSCAGNYFFSTNGSNATLLLNK